jgi:hypothetical protein
MKVFVGTTATLTVRNFGQLTEGSTDAEFKAALLIEPKISEYFTPEFLAKLQADGSPKPASPAKASA